MAITISVRVYTLNLSNGAELGTFTDLDELGRAFVAHFGKDYANLAGTLVDALKKGKDTERMESVLGVRVVPGYAELAA